MIYFYLKFLSICFNCICFLYSFSFSFIYIFFFCLQHTLCIESFHSFSKRFATHHHITHSKLPSNKCILLEFPFYPPNFYSIYTFSHKIKSNQGVLKVLEYIYIFHYFFYFCKHKREFFNLKKQKEERNNQSEYAWKKIFNVMAKEEMDVLLVIVICS